MGLVGDGILYVRLPDVMFKPRIPCAMSSSFPSKQKKGDLQRELFIVLSYIFSWINIKEDDKEKYSCKIVKCA